MGGFKEDYRALRAEFDDVPIRSFVSLYQHAVERELELPTGEHFSSAEELERRISPQADTVKARAHRFLSQYRSLRATVERDHYRIITKIINAP